MWLRDLQLDAFPQEMLTASENGASATGATTSQWVPKGTAIASAAECLILLTLSLKIFPDDFSGG